MVLCSYQEIIDFWFDEKNKAIWFQSNPVLDSELKEKFETNYLAACEGTLADWEQNIGGVLALVLLFDQIPLNMYRSDAKCFATDFKARELASRAISKGWHDALSDEQKAFLFMPFMHSENIDDQNTAVLLFEKAGLTEHLRYAHHHRDLIQRFGRFPHRNSILNRDNTDSEKNYLISGEAFLG